MGYMDGLLEGQQQIANITKTDLGNQIGQFQLQNAVENLQKQKQIAETIRAKLAEAAVAVPIAVFFSGLLHIWIDNLLV